MQRSHPIRLTRRQALVAGSGGVLATGAGLFELVRHGVIPGQHYLNEIDGACLVSSPPESFGAAGHSLTGSFFSHARNRQVGYTIAYPPGFGRGDRLPLALYMHGFGGSHTSGIGGMPIVETLAGRLRGERLPPLAIAVADGGRLYWHRHPGDDPMAMVVDELLPMCQQLGLGTRGDVGAIGVSMGGYGALLLAERHPRLIRAVGVISPAIFTSYAGAINADPVSFSSARDFAANDVIADTGVFAKIPLRLASGASDPFHPGVVEFVHALPHRGHREILLTAGCHDGQFFHSQQLQTVKFVGSHLHATA